MEKKNTGVYVVLAVFLVAGAFAYPRVRWFQFEMKARDAFADKSGLGRFPSRDQMVAVGPLVTQRASDYGFSDLKLQLMLERRDAGPVKFWYLKAAMSSGSHQFKVERRIETPISQDDLEWFGEQGVKVPIPADDNE